MKTEYSILQSVKSNIEILDEEWKSIKWNSIKYEIFKIQKRIFEAEKDGNLSLNYARAVCGESHTYGS